MRTEIAKTGILRPLAVLTLLVVLACLAAFAAPLAAAASPDVDEVELRVLPDPPYDTDSVRIHFKVVLPSPCNDVDFRVRADGVFEIAASSCPVLPPSGPVVVDETVDVGRLEPGTYEVRHTHDGALVEAITFTVLAAEGTCTPAADVLCLGDRRFRLEADWQANGQEGAGQAAAITRDTGRFSFFNPGNVELVAKVIDGCGTNDHFWVFAGGLTNVRTRLVVTDTTTGASKTYENPAGRAFRPVQDTGAFDCP